MPISLRKNLLEFCRFLLLEPFLAFGLPLSNMTSKCNRRLLKSRPTYATDPISRAATPFSSLLTTTLLVTPDFVEYAIRMLATTRPPVTVLPKSLRVCVVVLTGTSVPSRGCNERVFANCSVASREVSSNSMGAGSTPTYLQCS